MLGHVLKVGICLVAEVYSPSALRSLKMPSPVFTLCVQAAAFLAGPFVNRPISLSGAFCKVFGLFNLMKPVTATLSGALA